MILDSSRRKLDRARKHITDFEITFKRFIDQEPYERFAEPDAERPENTVHKIRLTRGVPDALAVIAADAVNNLRTALDQAIYTVAKAFGHNISHASFPFEGDATEFERAVSGKAKYLPNEIVALLRTFKTYKGGNNLLCALNDWCNVDKHALLVPAEHAAASLRTAIRATGFISVRQKPAWDRSKHEIVLFTVGPQTEDIHYEFDFFFFVSFDKVEAIRGKDAIGVLNALAGEVERVLMAIEAEARRIGILC